MAVILLSHKSLQHDTCRKTQQASRLKVLPDSQLSAMKKIEHIGNNVYFCKVCRKDLKNMVSSKGKDTILL